MQKSTPITEDPMAVFLYALKSPESKRQYPRRFTMFLDFLGFRGALEEQTKEFLRNAKRNPEWVQNILIQFRYNTFKRSSRDTSF